MSNSAFRTARWVLTCVAVIALCPLHGQTLPSLKESFQELVQGETLSAKPTQDELSSLGKRVSAASPGEIRDALPWMIAAAANADEVKRVYAFRALVGVGVRTDSPALLKEHIGDLVTLLASSDAYVQRFAMIVLGSVQSRQAAPVLGLSQALVAFVKRADRDLQAQLGALGSLLEKWQEEPSVQDAVEGFLSRDLDVETRIQILLALGRGNARGRPVRFIDLIIAALGNPSIDVRTTAIDVLSRSGTPAMVRAEPSLRKLIQEADQPEVVKSAARKALRDAGLSPD